MKSDLLKKLNLILVTIILVLTLGITSTKAAEETTVVSAENWSEWQEEDYWEWHVRTTQGDKAYNGTHIVIDNDVIDFYGYGQVSYKDFLYKEYTNPGKKIFKFRIDESKASYHTLDGAGFIFNANIEDDQLTGYILLFREKDVCLYRIEDVDIETFETTSETTVETYAELITSVDKVNTSIHDLEVEATPTSIIVREAEEEILNIVLEPSLHVGESFGLISSYIQHDCSVLTQIEFSQLELEIEDYPIDDVETTILTVEEEEVEEVVEETPVEEEIVATIVTTDSTPKTETATQTAKVSTDTTTNSTKLPYTGVNTKIIGATIFILIITSAYFFIRMKK